MNVVTFTNIYNGGGVGVADFNNDGKPDLFFTGNMVSCRMYLNQSEDGQIQFLDITKAAGITTDRWCTGVAIADINDDGWPDMYISVSGSSIPEERQNYLFIHQGLNSDGIPFFKDMAEAYGLADQTYSTQAVFFDYDLDNDLDLFVAVNYADQFYGSSVNIPTPNQKRYSDRSDRLYKNMGMGEDGHPVFRDVSVEAGILHEGYTLGLVVYDINKDGLPDIYQANDFLSNDILYMNQGDGTFLNKIGDYFKHTTFAGMGMDISDYNNDSWPDIFVLDMTPADHKRQKSMLLPTKASRFMANLDAGYYPQYNRNTLQLNNGFAPNGNLSFSEIGQLANIHHTDWSWTILSGDMNNSGYRDLMVCNGFRRDLQDLDNINFLFGDNPFGTRENWEAEFVKKVQIIDGIYIPNYLFKNNGDLTFSDYSAAWGFVEPSYSNGGVMADLDGDGDLDIVISNLNDYPFIYQNTSRSIQRNRENSNYLKIRLHNNLYNAFTAGTKINIYHNDQSQYYQHFLVRGYLSSIDPEIHFGLGQDTIIDSLEITWPDGTFNILRNISTNQTLLVERGVGKEEVLASESVQTKLFNEISEELSLNYKHEERKFDDFEIQPLLLHKYSQNGPGMAVSDVNGDGLDDIFIGGSRTYPSSILIQNRDGSFTKTVIPETEEYEDMGALFFDADGDGDNDLYIVSGGFENTANSDFYLDRLYMNDGKGHFTIEKTAIPRITSSGSCVIGYDYDLDGDTDLFVGGRVTPGKFPAIPESHILRNDSYGDLIRFTDVTDEIAPGLKNIGMVTAALWTDYNNDNLIDLLVVGEWMPITFFRNTGSSFVKLTGETGLDFSEGWWNSIIGADFDKDGDIDYIAGNLGRNSWLKANQHEPLTLLAADFDRNGIIDPLFFNVVDGIKVPFHSRMLMVAQLNYLDKKYPTHSDYAKATLETILDESQRNEAMKFHAYNFNTSYIENLGNSQFRITPLSNENQLAPVSGITVGDFDMDGFYDVLLVGNAYSSSLRMGWYDASIGAFLKGKGDGSFTTKLGTKSNFYIDSDAKSMVKMRGAEFKELIVVASNSDTLKVFIPNHQADHDITLKSEYAFGLLFFMDGSKQRIEFYRGGGYLSADGANLFMSNLIQKIEFYSAAGILIYTWHNEG